MNEKMLLLGFLLVPVVCIAADVETIINNYIVKIIDATLISVQSTEKSSHELNLSGLGLRVLKKGAFGKLPTLRTLNVENNSLSDIPKEAFSRLIALEHLSLANNNISRFKSAFGGMKHLKTLNISNNPIDKLRCGDLYGLSKSCVISTKGLSFSTIDPRVFDTPSKFPYGMDEDDLEGTNEQETSWYDDGDEITFKMCIQDDVLKLIAPIKKNETMSNGCQLRTTGNQGISLLLSDFGIAKFEKDWYRLENTSIQTLTLNRNKIVEMTKEILNDLPANIRAVWIEGNKIERLKKGIIENKYITSLTLVSNVIREIEEGAFAQMSLLQKLYLNGNQLEDTTFLNSLPPTVTLLHLQTNKIAGITPGSFLNAAQFSCLHLDGNLIQELKDDSLRGLQNVGALTLDNNRIFTIPRGFFQHTPNLVYISLSGNSIATFEKGLFDNLRKLETLIVKDNKLANFVKEHSLHGLENLRFLNLDNNSISTIYPGFFQHTPNLMYIHLSGNSIATLKKGLFDNLRNLTHLYVQSNKLSNIKENFPDGLPASLDLLRLDFNEIEKLQRGTFINVPKTYLTLTGNKISKIEQRSFDLPSLRELNLDNNTLFEIDADSFQGLNDIETLSLRANGMTKIPKGFTRHFRHLKVLKLGSNPIKRLENNSLPGLRSSFCKIVVHVEDAPIDVIEGGLFDNL